MLVNTKKLSQFWQVLQSGKALRIILTSIWLILLLTVFSKQVAFGQKSFITNYTEADYGSNDYTTSPQNWGIIQDNYGRILAGNATGVLIFDGSDWSMVRGTENLSASYFARDNYGNIFTFGKDREELGYIGVDNRGRSEYFSLLHFLPDSGRNVGQIYAIIGIENEIYFEFKDQLFRYRDSVFFQWDISIVSDLFDVNGQLIFQDSDQNIIIQKDEDFQILISVNNDLNLALAGIYALDDGSYLLFDMDARMFIAKHNQLSQIETHFGDQNTQITITDVCQVTNDLYALVVRGKGLIIVNSEGQLVKRIDKNLGLGSNTVYTLFQDTDGGLWAGLDNGISRIQISNPLSYYDHTLGLEGVVLSAAQKGDWLYAGTTAGLFTMNTKTEEEFSKIPGFREVWDIQLINDEIIVASGSGVHKLRNNRIIVTIDVNARAILMTDYPDIIWVGLSNGVGRIDVSGEKWQWEGKLPGISHEVRTMAFESDSILWASFEQVSRLIFSDPRDTNPEIITFGETHGINENFFLIEPNIIQDKVVFGTGDGIYYYDPDIQEFRAETTFGAEFINKEAWAIAEDFDQSIWICSVDYDAILSHLPDGTYSTDSISLAPLFGTDIWKIIPQDKDIIWLCTTDGLYKYDKSQPKVEGRAFQALITRVEINRDSIVTYLEGSESSRDFEYVINEFTRSQDDIRFRFTAPSYYKDELLKYSFKLEGYDKDWSVWTEENQKEYTNLPANNYKFRVRATNLYGFISEEAIYSFRVLPAWWETWLAKVCYFLFSILIIYLIIRWRTASLTRKQKRLEYKIQLATKEIRKQKEEVEDQKEEIESQRDEIEVQRDEVEAQRDQLELQRDVVVSQKNEIIESINYAQRIQSAMLPPETYITELLNENFILYKPRDIVSGDFYWVKQVNQYIVLVAADCTGHGVPGALMSMLGISYLNEIVQRREITQANQILNELRKQIKYSLRQHGQRDESKDGIDMALCVLDSRNMTMQYSGANNPLYLIRDLQGKPELKEIKADRMPLGYYQGKDISFNNHDIQLEIGDTYYMFSDGFIDQKGGKDNKKFMSKNFKDLLLEINDQPMHDQKAILEKTLKDWMGSNSQVDDILVVGVRV